MRDTCFCKGDQDTCGIHSRYKMMRYMYLRVGMLVGWCPMVVRFVCVTRVPVCACVSRVCPGSPGVLLPTFYRHELRVSCLVYLTTRC
jgi:hypothetical protein